MYLPLAVKNVWNSDQAPQCGLGSVVSEGSVQQNARGAFARGRNADDFVGRGMIVRLAAVFRVRFSFLRRQSRVSFVGFQAERKREDRMAVFLGRRRPVPRRVRLGRLVGHGSYGLF
ncbi:hypothetical protein VTJ04DRAFT_8120 [Mycothermus thermophilus]|uniref:uncharacterized protein n=1 Tax=Humicola insolens TaxID=85995 RepID=UPI003741EACF